jgi:hypothetical protein
VTNCFAQPPVQTTNSLQIPIPYVIPMMPNREDCFSQASVLHVKSNKWWDIGFFLSEVTGMFTKDEAEKSRSSYLRLQKFKNHIRWNFLYFESCHKRTDKRL